MTEEELAKLREWSRAVISTLRAAGIRAGVQLYPPGNVLELHSVPVEGRGLSPYRTTAQACLILADSAVLMEKAIGDHVGWWADYRPDRFNCC